MPEPNAIALPQIKGFPKIQRCAAAAEMAVPLAVLAIIVALITPMPRLPAGLPAGGGHHAVGDRADGLDVHHRSRSDFNVFPTTLLLLTLFRLALNISSSRLILLNGNIGHVGGRRRDRGVRQLRGRRQLHHRRRDLPGPDRDSVRRHQPWRGAHFGSHGALHPGRHARQADVDRFRSEFRPDRRRRRRAPAARRWPRKPNSTAPWTARRDSRSATPWRASSSPASTSWPAF